MKKEEIKNKLLARKKGAYTNIMFLSDLISNKDNKERRVQKLVKAIACFGITYSHMAAVKEKMRITGDKEPNKLRWGEWDPDCSLFIRHNGNYYLRCTVSRSPRHHTSVSYLLDGKPATLEEIIPVVRPSELAPRKDLVYDLKVEHVLGLVEEAK